VWWWLGRWPPKRFVGRVKVTACLLPVKINRQRLTSVLTKWVHFRHAKQPCENIADCARKCLP
jgi:hypothetical protein